MQGRSYPTILAVAEHVGPPFICLDPPLPSVAANQTRPCCVGRFPCLSSQHNTVPAVSLPVLRDESMLALLCHPHLFFFEERPDSTPLKPLNLRTDLRRPCTRSTTLIITTENPNPCIAVSSPNPVQPLPHSISIR